MPEKVVIITILQYVTHFRRGEARCRGKQPCALQRRPGNAGPPSGALKNVEHTYEFSSLDRILENATDEELAQARRDWQVWLGGWTRLNRSTGMLLARM